MEPSAEIGYNFWGKFTRLICICLWEQGVLLGTLNID